MNTLGVNTIPATPASPAPSARGVENGPQAQEPRAFAMLLERNTMPAPAESPVERRTNGQTRAAATERPAIGRMEPPAEPPTNVPPPADAPGDRVESPIGDGGFGPIDNQLPRVDGPPPPADGVTPIGAGAVMSPMAPAQRADAPPPNGTPVDVPGLESGAANAGTRTSLPGSIDPGGRVAGPGPKVNAPTDEREAPIGRPLDVAPPIAGVPTGPAEGVGSANAERIERQPVPAGPGTVLPAPIAGSGPFEHPIGAVPRGPEAPVTPPEVSLPMAPQSPAFAPALGAQLRMWVRDGIQQAVLQLNPADLGPVAVQIALDGSQAHVDFVAAQAATRAALEASLPTLAAALRDSGLTLAGGGVFDQPRGQPDERAPQPGTVGSGPDNGPGNGPAPTTNATARGAAVRARGVVDLVA